MRGELIILQLTNITCLFLFEKLTLGFEIYHEILTQENSKSNESKLL